MSFCGVAAIAVGSTVLASYEFLFRPVEFSPLVKAQLNNYVDTLVSQQVEGGDDDGGFRFSQSAISNDAQVWTTAQCLVALLQQDPVVVKQIAPSLQRAFSYINRSRLKSPERGWGYLRSINWGGDRDRCVGSVAYLYSLSGNNAALIWSSSEYPDVIERTRVALDQLLKRQHDDGGWSPIEKTPNPRHIRTYSTIMAVWAIAEAERNSHVIAGDDARIQSALRSGVKWITASYELGNSGFSGWWPNPSSRSLVGEYPGLTAQTLFVLSDVAKANPFVRADTKYIEAIETFVTFAFNGNATFAPFATRKIDENEKAHDSDRYLEGRNEMVEQSSFLWYPWTIAMAAALEHDPSLEDYQRGRLHTLSSMLLKRIDEEKKFVRNDEVIYPTAEIVLTAGYYFSQEGKITNRR